MITKNEDQPWLTVKDVARLFQVTERTVRNWLKKGLMVGSKLGGRVRIAPAEVLRFAKENQLRPGQVGRPRRPRARTDAGKARPASRGKKKNR